MRVTIFYLCCSTLEISDGTGMALALHRIDPLHFSDSWLSKIKENVPSDNKHLKATNLRKILLAIVDFNDVVPFVSLADFGQPNINNAAEGQPDEIGENFNCLLSFPRCARMGSKTKKKCLCMTPIFFESIYPKTSKKGRKKIFGVQKFDFLTF